MKHARYYPEPLGYEVSSRGDTRFSALYAKLADGRSIEEAYQLDVKGYRAISDDWHDGKGNAPYYPKTKAQLWQEYLELWRLWVSENPEAFADLIEKSKGKVLTDKFATTEINQAHALAVLISEVEAIAKFNL